MPIRPLPGCLIGPRSYRGAFIERNQGLVKNEVTGEKIGTRCAGLSVQPLCSEKLPGQVKRPGDQHNTLLADPGLPDQVLDLNPGLVLLQYPDDLLFTVSLALHPILLSCLLPGKTNTANTTVYGGSATTIPNLLQCTIQKDSEDVIIFIFDI